MLPSPVANSVSMLDKRHRVEVFDASAQLDEATGEWSIQVRGYVGRPRPDSIRRRLFFRFVRRALRFTPEEMDSPIFRQRVQGFMMIPPKRRPLRVLLGDQPLELPKKTRRDGFFAATLSIPRGLVETAEGDVACGSRWVEVKAVDEENLRGMDPGRLLLVSPQGPSVISDIDDTLKLSQVGDRENLFANTFLRPFRAVEGMAELYSTWHQSGATFHYVSSSPWQLYRPLKDFFGECGFPPGAFHLRVVKLRGPRVMQLFMGRKRAKRKAILSILRMYPGRRFILVGDSGEKDAEIYAELWRKHPDQIARILIRDVPGKELSPKKRQKAFGRIPRDAWSLFRRPEELANWVPAGEAGWIQRPTADPPR